MSQKAIQKLNQRVTDWENSVKPQGRKFPLPGRAIVGLSSAGLDLIGDDEKVVAKLIWVVKYPEEYIGDQVEDIFWLESQNDDGSNFGIGQFLDRCVNLKGYADGIEFDRETCNDANTLQALCDQLQAVGLSEVGIEVVQDVSFKDIIDETGHKSAQKRVYDRVEVLNPAVKVNAESSRLMGTVINERRGGQGGGQGVGNTSPPVSQNGDRKPVPEDLVMYADKEFTVEAVDPASETCTLRRAHRVEKRIPFDKITSYVS